MYLLKCMYPVCVSIYVCNGGGGGGGGVVKGSEGRYWMRAINQLWH